MTKRALLTKFMGSMTTLLLLAVPCSIAEAKHSASAMPHKPRISVDTSGQRAGRTVFVGPKGDLQTAIDQAKPGDTILLAKGAHYVGPFLLPRKSGKGWITIRAGEDALLPAEKTRLKRAHFSRLPKLLSKRGPVLKALAGAHHYRFIGLEIGPEQGAFLHNVVEIGEAHSSSDTLPHHFVFERCYVRGDKILGSRRGIALNGSHIAVTDSHFADFKEVGADSQALAGWSGPGPFLIENNYLEAAGENIMFGGADPPSPERIPADIVVRRNHFAKNTAWKSDEPNYEGSPWTVKNLLELKNARRVHIESNLFEKHWAHAQSGYAILFTVRNQDGKAPWSVVEDVTFENNIVRNVASGINILGRDKTHASGSRRTSRVHINNNLFEDVGHERWGGGGVLLQLLEGTQDVVVESNTAFHRHNIITADGAAHANLIFRNNIVTHNAYGIIGSGQGIGHSTISAYFPGAVVTRNIIAGGNENMYPPGNFFPKTMSEAGVRVVGKPAPGSGVLTKYRQVNRGQTRIGADITLLRDAQLCSQP